ncbi:hypothetical protein Sgleb_03200 [Streptomyces glebosus]|uniref:Uncharacterized protein n=1 Tax=Streptomyces glebosus TaxID=249580 RepID=A0A640SL69_9ACTN|nr:hypothetical protein [Streptomyces glebosus]GFE12273.1 hypothetical protein Sgleb_03200 [Streptomyces glebosus]GHG72186.1 hypothetical protein GCM10010513_44790 [Streptomyces glebosus]
MWPGRADPGGLGGRAGAAPFLGEARAGSPHDLTASRADGIIESAAEQDVESARLRTPAERPFAELKCRRALHKIRISPGRVTVLLHALLALDPDVSGLHTQTDSVRDSFAEK